MGFFSFFNNWFGRVGQSGGSIRVTEPTRQQGQFPTTLDYNDASMQRQHEAAQQYRASIEQAARASNLPVAVICGIGSRESHWGLILKPPGPGGTGDFSTRNPRSTRTGSSPPDGGGFGRGLMQIDYDWHEFARTGNWRDPHANLLYAADVLNQARRFFETRGVPPDRIMRTIIAAYNAGATATFNCYQSNSDIDCNTTGRDYSKDVLNRAGWFELHGW